MSDQKNGKTQALDRLSPAAAPLARDLQMDRERLALLTRTIGADLKADELQLFLAVCARTKLDPFLKQIYPIKDKSGRFFIHVGIDGRRVVAQRTKLVDGMLGPFWAGADGEWKDVWLAKEPPAAAKVALLKKGCKEPFWAIAHLRGFRGTDGSRWGTDPAHMLAKVAEDHALRKAFPYEMGGVPTYRPEHDQAPDGDDAPSDPSPTHHAEAEWAREIDQDTGEITETPKGVAADVTPEPREAARAGSGGADSSHAPAADEEPPHPADALDAHLAEHAAANPPRSGQPAWWDTPLGRDISGLVDQLDEAKARYTLPPDTATEGQLQDWIGARRSWLAARGQPVGAK